MEVGGITRRTRAPPTRLGDVVVLKRYSAALALFLTPSIRVLASASSSVVVGLRALVRVASTT